MEKTRQHRAGWGLWPAMALMLGMALGACGGGPEQQQDPPQQPPQPAALRLELMASGFTNPVDLQAPADGSVRLFVVEQRGTIRIIQNGALRADNFLDISGPVVDGGERGLLGLAFHPQFAQNRRFYVNYTAVDGSGQLETVIAEYLASASDANVAEAGSERRLLTYDQPFENHNGGQLAFGPDGFLYIASGDGGGSGDPDNNGQNIETLLGKILRIDVNTTTTTSEYGIPPTNPFVNRAGRDEIFAYGLRNPWRMSFDRSGGRLFVGDVGQGAEEEVNIVTNGGNYGWKIMEGTSCFQATSCNTAGLTLPIHSYPRTDGRSISGGYVYRGTALGTFAGTYVFGDFITGRMWGLVENPPGAWTRSDLLSPGFNISSFGQDQAGELYVLDYGNGVVYRLARQ